MAVDGNYDVVVIGGSLAGCAAARLLARAGLSVAVVEQHADPQWHKRLCTHYIQACAAPTVQRLGLEPLLAEAGAVRSRMEIWTRWGWIRHAVADDPATRGYCIRRQALDPLVRRLTADTPGVELLSGWRVKRLTARSGSNSGSNYDGCELQNPAGETRELTARLVVAADGRNSTLAELDDVPTRLRPNQRFTYFAYYRNLPLTSGADAQYWMLDPQVAYAWPSEDGITLLACWVTKYQLPSFRADREAAFEKLFPRRGRGPGLGVARRP